jgi:hypothetical protein
MITVILSVFNEKQNDYLLRILNQFRDDDFFEVVCVDGGSTDGTLEYLRKQNVMVHTLPGSTRAARLTFGVTQARFPILLLQHPRSVISEGGLNFLKKQADQLHWAAFTHQFDYPHFFLKFISWYSNQVRVKKKAIVYLDHCMVLQKKYFDVDAIPDIAIFEDTELSNAINKQCRPVLLPYHVTTSAVRFLDRGIYKQFMFNQCMKVLHYFNYNDRKLNRLYERHLNLNQNN